MPLSVQYWQPFTALGSGPRAALCWLASFGHKNDMMGLNESGMRVACRTTREMQFQAENGPRMSYCPLIASRPQLNEDVS
jgi:hypothetical protein